MLDENDTNPLTEMVSDIVSNEPEVREATIEEMEKRREETIDDSNDTSTDKSVGFDFPVGGGSEPSTDSVRFDPAIHETNKDGTPRVTSKGEYRRKRGKKPGTKSGTKPDIQSNPEPVANTDYRGTAQFLCSLTFGSLQSFLGKEWEPSSNERENIETQATRYCESKGITDLPPGIALSLALGMYALPRLQYPETQEKLKGIAYKLGLAKKPTVKRDVVQTVTPVETVRNEPSNGYRGL